jgi:hypothetical protein
MYEHYEAQLRLRPDDAHALDAYWRAACAAGEHARVLDWLQRAVAADPEVPGFHYMLGVTLQGPRALRRSERALPRNAATRAARRGAA